MPLQTRQLTPDHDCTCDDAWSVPNVELLQGWGAAWARRRQYHSKWSSLLTLSWYTLALPAISLPIIFQQLAARAEGAEAESIVMGGFMSCAALAAAQSFLHLDAVAARHQISERAYAALVADLDAELARRESARRSVTLAVADYKARAQQILMASPSIPERCWCPFLPPRREPPPTG